MNLLKLVPDPEMNLWAQNKALEILNSIPSKNLIMEAYLFGSAVDGNFTPDSDLDLIVVTRDETSIRQLKSEVYAPRFTDIAIDWIFQTKDSFEERKKTGGVCFVAYNDGIKLR